MIEPIGDTARKIIENLAARAGPGRLFVATTETGPQACKDAAEALSLAGADEQAKVWIGTLTKKTVWFHFVWGLVDQGQVFDAGGNNKIIEKVSE